MIRLLTGDDTLEIDISSPEQRAKLFAVINKPTNRLYTEPIILTDEQGGVIVDVPSPAPEAVAFFATVASALEFAGMQQNTVGDDETLDLTRISAIGAAALEAAVKTLENPDGLDDLAAALEKVAQSVVESRVINGSNNTVIDD